MLCIDNTYTDVYFNLAAEEYLLKNFPDDIFMLWQNDLSVIIGKHQNLQTEVNLDFIGEKQIKVARRYSGGGTVYHDSGNLNLTFIESNDHPDFDKYSRQMLEFLSTIGIHAEADERHSLYVDGLKISGSAQYLRKNKVLYHATLLYSSNLNYLASTLESPYAHSGNDEETRPWRHVKSVKSPVTNISGYLTCPMPIDEFKKLIINYFINNGTNNYIYQFSLQDITAIDQLKQEKYATNSWNYQT